MLHSEGFTCTNNVDKAQILNTSVFTHDNDSPVSYLGSSPYPNFPLFETSIEEVYTLMIHLRLYRSTQMVFLPSYWKSELSPSLTLLFNSSLEQGRIPDHLKI